MRRIPAGLLLIVFPVLLHADEFSSLMARAEAALRAKDYESAQRALEKAVAMRPADATAHYELGRAYEGQKKYQFATDHLKEALRLSPGHPGALIDLAAIEANSGRFDQAIAHYEDALRREPDVRARRGLAKVMAKQGRTDEAIAALKALLADAPGDTTSRYQLGTILMQNGDCRGAVEQFRRVTREDPQHRGAWYNLGNCLGRIGRGEEAARARERFRQVARAQDTQVDRRRRGYFLLIEADRLLQEGKLREALAKIEQGVRINPDDAKLHAVHGQCLDALGDDAGALAAYRRSADLNPLDPIVMVETGRLSAKTNHMDEAITYLEEAARLDPLMPEPHRFLAAIYHGMGREEAAAREQATYRRLAAARKNRPH
ncbi:MAG: tetratricopeptide repeat protein [Acidobacteriota bacterium]